MFSKLLLGIEEAAEATGIGRSKFYELLADGSIESVKVGRRRLIPAAALVEFVDGLRTGPPSAHGNGAPGRAPAPGLASATTDLTRAGDPHGS